MSASDAGLAPPIDVQALLDTRPVGGRQIMVVALCGLVALLDGLDLQSIGLAAPAMMGALHVPPPAFGAVFSAALAGLAIGAFSLGPVADRVGRKRVLVVATLCFGVFTLATASATNLTTLLTYRFGAGLGLGGAMPSFISLACEYLPRRLRPAIVSLLWAGFPLGGVFGGLLGSRIIPEYGWPSIFIVGGVIPVLLGLVLIVVLPESIAFLLASGAPAEQIAATLKGILGPLPPGARFVRPDTRAEGVPIGRLFQDGRAVATVLLWVAFFSGFMVLVINSAWVPLLLRGVGIEIARSALALAVFNFGSVIGSGGAGYLVARFGALAVLPVSFLGSAVSFAAIGYAAPDIAGVTVAEGALGIFLGCASSGLIALAAVSYPTAMRSTGVGWSMGMGRFGSFVGPLAVAALVGAKYNITEVCAAVGASLLVGAVAVVAIGARTTLSSPAPLGGRRGDGTPD